MKTRLFSLWLLLSVAVGLSAYDFNYNALCYNYIGMYTVEVTYRYSNSSGYEGLKIINIPDRISDKFSSYGVVSIGKRAFHNCTGLTYVSIPNSVRSIGEDAFYNCSGLTSITIPNSVKSIGDVAFRGCTGLTSVTIPNSVTSIGERTFQNCTGLISIVVEPDNTNYDSRENCNAIIDTKSNVLLTGCKTTTIPNSVTNIGDYAFCWCTGLTSVTIPNSVTSIGKGAFYGCTGLTSVTIPNSVKSIVDGAFRECTGLTSVTIPNSVTSIGGSAFSGCTGLTSVTIPNSITSIGGSVFSGCTGLTSVTIPNSVTSIGDSAFSGCTGLTSVTIPNSITSIGGSAFSGCTGLTSVTIPNSITSIGGSAFSGCTGLTSVTIPNSITSIGGSAFSGCKNMETVVFGSAVETIGASAFSGCQSIYEMTIYATKVPTIQENTFAGVGTGATLRVPAGCVQKYKAHPYWGVFNIEEIPSEYTITVTCDSKHGQVTGSGTYTEGSEVTITAIPYKGYEFVRWSDGNTANPYSFLAEKSVTIEALFEPTTPIENVAADNADTPNKIIRDGQVLILRDGKTYTTMGVEVNE